MLFGYESTIGFGARGYPDLPVALGTNYLRPHWPTRSPVNISKRKEPTLGDKGVNLRPEWRCFRGPKVVDEQAHIAAHSTADELQRFLPRQETPIDQSNLFRYAESRKFLSQIIHDIPAR